MSGLAAGSSRQSRLRSLEFSRSSEDTLGSFLLRFCFIFGTKLGGVLLFRVGCGKDVWLLVSCWGLVDGRQQQGAAGEKYLQQPAGMFASEAAAAALSKSNSNRTSNSNSSNNNNKNNKNNNNNNKNNNNNNKNNNKNNKNKNNNNHKDKHKPKQQQTTITNNTKQQETTTNNKPWPFAGGLSWVPLPPVTYLDSLTQGFLFHRWGVLPGVSSKYVGLLGLPFLPWVAANNNNKQHQTTTNNKKQQPTTTNHDPLPGDSLGSPSHRSRTSIPWLRGFCFTGGGSFPESPRSTWGSLGCPSRPPFFWVHVLRFGHEIRWCFAVAHVPQRHALCMWRTCVTSWKVSVSTRRTARRTTTITMAVAAIWCFLVRGPRCCSLGFPKRFSRIYLDPRFSRISEGTLGTFLPRFFVLFGTKLGGVLLFRNRFETAGPAIILFRRFWGIRPKQLAQLGFPN